MVFKLPSHSLRSIYFAIAILSLLALTPSYALAQSLGWSIISTAPSPILPNTPSSITVRFSAEFYPTRTVYCPNVFGGKGVLSVTAKGDVITVEQSISPYKAPFPGFDLFCDAKYDLPPLAAGRYEVRLKFVDDFPYGPPPSEPFVVGSVCVGICVIQQVPVNFASGSLLWWFAVVSLAGMGTLVLRQRLKK
jgi:hypothetical protein